MRRFRVKEPAEGLFVGARNAETVGDAKFVACGAVAVFQDDDPRIPSVAANPCFEELDENDEAIEYVSPQPVVEESAFPPPPPPAPKPEPVVTFDYPTVSVAEPVEDEPAEAEPVTDEVPAEKPEPKTRKRRAAGDDAESEVGAA